MSETGLVIVVGGVLAAVGMGYYLGRKSAPTPKVPSTGVSYTKLQPQRFVPLPDPPPLPVKDVKKEARRPHAPSDAEMYYREVEGPPKEHW